MITVSTVEAEKRLDELIDLVELEDETVTIAVGPDPRVVMLSSQRFASMTRGLWQES
jgi:PHD/YefM family antitoxin component YafN of YafNO toxin-antitoxin module